MNAQDNINYNQGNYGYPMGYNYPMNNSGGNYNYNENYNISGRKIDPDKVDMDNDNKQNPYLKALVGALPGVAIGALSGSPLVGSVRALQGGYNAYNRSKYRNNEIENFAQQGDDMSAMLPQQFQQPYKNLSSNDQREKFMTTYVPALGKMNQSQSLTDYNNNGTLDYNQGQYYDPVEQQTTINNKLDLLYKLGKQGSSNDMVQGATKGFAPQMPQGGGWNGGENPPVPQGTHTNTLYGGASQVEQPNVYDLINGVASDSYNDGIKMNPNYNPSMAHQVMETKYIPINSGIQQQNANTSRGNLSQRQVEFAYQQAHPEGTITPAQQNEYANLNDNLYEYNNKKGGMFNQPAISQQQFEQKTGYTPKEASKYLSQQRGKGVNAGRGNIPNGAIDYLRKNPNLASQFDAKYGKGSSKQILGK